MLDMTTCAAITDVVTTYVEGMCQNDPEKLRGAMHPGCSIIGHFDGGLEWESRDGFIAVVDKAVTAPDPAPWYAIRSISVLGDVATVHVEDVFLGGHYDDTLILLNHQGRWVIVSKVFYLRPAS